MKALVDEAVLMDTVAKASNKATYINYIINYMTPLDGILGVLGYVNRMA